MTDQWMFWFIE